MEKWQRFSKANSNLGLTDGLSIIIGAEIGELSDEFFSYEGPKLRPRQTRLIKDKLSLLGKRPLRVKPEYKVYANGISEDLRQENKGHFRIAEWLYDMHWYLDGDEPYTTTVVPLVMECEWDPVHRKDRKKIKYDF